MRKLTVFLVVLVVVLSQVIPVYTCLAWPSSNLYQEGDDVFDDWHVCRTNGCGEYGFLQWKRTRTTTGTRTSFRPLIVFESLGEYTGSAYKLGSQFVEKYPDRYQRAEKIFEFVRDRMQYTLDIDQFDIGECAHNADEVADTLQKEGIAYNDCEEFAILLAVMYQGAGYRSAIIACPNHAAVLVHLPGYEKASRPLKLEGEPGWIWAEATGKTNPFGWCPIDKLEQPILGQEIFPDEHLPPGKEEPPPKPEPEPIPEPEPTPEPEPEPEPIPEPEPEPIPEPPAAGGGPSLLSITFPGIIVLALVGLIILLSRKRKA